MSTLRGKEFAQEEQVLSLRADHFAVKDKLKMTELLPLKVYPFTVSMRVFVELHTLNYYHNGPFT